VYQDFPSTFSIIAIDGSINSAGPRSDNLQSSRVSFTLNNLKVPNMRVCSILRNSFKVNNSKKSLNPVGALILAPGLMRSFAFS